MTSEQSPPSRPARPGVAARRQALGVATGAPTPPTRESLRDSLARIPDLEPAGAGGAAGASSRTDLVSEPVEIVRIATPIAGAAAGAVAGDRGAGATRSAIAPDGAAASAGEDAPIAPSSALARAILEAPPVVDAPADLDDDGPRASWEPPVAPEPVYGRRPIPMWRRVAFAIVLIGLVVSIPVLGYAGMQVIRDSTEGDVVDANLTPSDPGYEAQVDPTPTAVAIQYDDDGNPNGLTFLTLAGADGGGAVVFVPLDTEVTEPAYGVDRLRTSYDVVKDRPALARERLASQTGRLLNVGIEEIIDLTNAGWEQLVMPVGPLLIENPEEVDLGYGQIIPSGPASLEANQVGRYLAYRKPGESDLNRLNRHEAVWSAWLAQVAASGRDDAVPGESTAGIARFAQQLAAGDVTFDTLPVDEGDQPGVFTADAQAVNQLITDIVASPTGAVPGGRFTVRLLNGVAAEPIPADVVKQVVGRGGAVTILGNGPEFGTDETEIVYANPAKKQLAELLAASLGAEGMVRLDREAPDTVDLTIVLGKDVLGDETRTGTPGATTPDTVLDPTASGGS